MRYEYRLQAKVAVREGAGKLFIVLAPSSSYEDNPQ